VGVRNVVVDGTTAREHAAVGLGQYFQVGVRNGVVDGTTAREHAAVGLGQDFQVGVRNGVVDGTTAREHAAVGLGQDCNLSRGVALASAPPVHHCNTVAPHKPGEEPGAVGIEVRR
jgi:hypothetical protein